MNLLNETIEALDSEGLYLDDVKYINTSDGYMDVDDFVRVAKEIEYDNGFGTAKIDTNLVIVGINWWLSRYEYDGSEGWYFCTEPPRKLNKSKTMNLLEDTHV